MLNSIYYVCSAYYPVSKYLLGKAKYFQEIQLHWRSWLQSWLVEVSSSFSFTLPPLLIYGEGFDWDQHSDKPISNQCYSPSCSHIYQQSRSTSHYTKLLLACKSQPQEDCNNKTDYQLYSTYQKMGHIH